MKKKLLGFLSVICAFSVVFGTNTPVLADRVDEDLNKPYLSLGNDLTPSERATVLELFKISESDLENYDVKTVTNEDEHRYLGDYLDASVIGTKALSSVMVVGKESGNGIQVTTKNISYCTTGMYQNALATAGVKDADITVVGPYKISGTAALVGAIKAYESMTGEEVPQANLEVANNELVVTGEIADSVGDAEKAEQLVAIVKEEVAKGGLASKEDIQEVIDKAVKELDIELTEEDQKNMTALMEKIDGLDLDVETIKDQAKDLYDKLDELDINIDKESIGDFFAKIIDAIVEFFRNLFS
jgi:uncharacterized protein YpuA (DUF1002 family)